MSRAIVTVGVSGVRAFGAYLQRFERTFRKYGACQEFGIWSTSWPPGSPSHAESHYAFKVHAVLAAHARGHDQVLWFDSSCYAIRSLEALWQRLERDGHVLVEDSEPLGKWSSDHSLRHFGVTRDEAMGLRLMCGTCWGVDFRSERSRRFVEKLQELAIPEHFNGTHMSRNPAVAAEHPRPNTEGWWVSNDERCWGHRSDEVYMTLLARELGMVTHVGVEFVGGADVNEHACVRSGYDLA